MEFGVIMIYKMPGKTVIGFFLNKQLSPGNTGLMHHCERSTNYKPNEKQTNNTCAKRASYIACDIN